MDEISQMTGVDLSSAAESGANRSNTVWCEVQQDGEWRDQNGTAGGCANYPGTFILNLGFLESFIDVHAIACALDEYSPLRLY